MRSGIALLVTVAAVSSRLSAAEPPAATNRTAAAVRPAHWAAAVELPGVPNLHRVSDRLYRSAQPTAEGMKNLRSLGIRTVVNLRSFHSDRDEIGNEPLGHEHIYMKAWHPEREDVVRFLRIAADTNRTPVLVHCLHGADRTGTLCALYRIAVQGWTADDALREMADGGFGFHEVFENLPRWVAKLDIEAVRAEAGIAAPRSERQPSADRR